MPHEYGIGARRLRRGAAVGFGSGLSAEASMASGVISGLSHAKRLSGVEPPSGSQLGVRSLWGSQSR